MKFMTTFLIGIFFSITSIAQITGDWLGTLEVQGVQFEIVLHIQSNDEVLTTTMDIPAQNVSGLKADNTTFQNDTLLASWESLGIRINGYMNDDGSLSTHFQQGTYNIPITFVSVKDKDKLPKIERPQDPKPPFDYEISLVTFNNVKDKIKLAGTLTLPKDIKDPPIVILVSGSGQQDRNEEIFGHKPFWVIADDFAKKGIGVLRYDDRGVGLSEGASTLSNATSEDFARDAEAALDYLLGARYTHIGYAGHSEGGMIAPMVAAQRKEVEFIILMAGPGIPCDSLLALQTYQSSVASGTHEAIAQYNKKFTMQVADFIKKYKGNNLETALTNRIHIILAEDEMTKTMADDQKKMIVEQTVSKMSSPWMQYFLQYEPDHNLKKLKCPVLAINGSRDVQVTATENLAGIEAALKKSKSKSFQLQELKDLNHLFQPSVTGSISEYSSIPTTFSTDALDLMSDWIHKQMNER